MRILVIGWLVLQVLLLVAIVATHMHGPTSDHRIILAMGMVVASYPLSLLTLYVAITSMDAMAITNNWTTILVMWTMAFIAGATQLSLVYALVKWIRKKRAAAR